LVGGRARLWRSRVPCGRDRQSQHGGDPAAGGHAGAPILRSASSGDADHSTTDAARRRLGVIREVLHTLTTPTFGKRGNSPKSLTSEERYRQMLGLPHGPRLSAPEIHQAWKRAAKAAHPDSGGSTQRFQELSAARDALIKQVRLARIS